MTAPRVLLIGHGDFGRLYAEALRDTGALAGIAVRTEATATRLRETLREPVHVGAARAMDTVRPDAIAVLSPTDWHCAHANLGIDARVPVLVIKPAACTPDAAESLASRAAAAGVAVMVGHEGVFSPAFRAVEQLVFDGSIGAVREIGWLRAGPERLSGGRVRRPDDRAADENLGHVYATVMHDLYVTNRLAGRHVPARADVVHIVTSSNSPELQAEVHYANGMRARIKHDGRDGTSFRRGLHVVGERASVLWLVEPGRTSVRIRRGREERDVTYPGGRGENPALPVVEAFLRVVAGAVPDETLLDGARALRAARMVTLAAAERLGLGVNMDALAGGVDRTASS